MTSTHRHLTLVIPLAGQTRRLRYAGDDLIDEMQKGCERNLFNIVHACEIKSFMVLIQLNCSIISRGLVDLNGN